MIDRDEAEAILDGVREVKAPDNVLAVPVNRVRVKFARPAVPAKLRELLSAGGVYNRCFEPILVRVVRVPGCTPLYEVVDLTDEVERLQANIDLGMEMVRVQVVKEQ